MIALASLNAVAEDGPPAVSQVLPQNRMWTVTLFMTDVKGAVPMSVSAPNCVLKTAVRSCLISSCSMAAGQAPNGNNLFRRRSLRRVLRRPNTRVGPEHDSHL